MERLSTGTKAVLALGVLGLLLIAASSASAANDFRLKPGARGKLCVECHDAFDEVLARRHLHTPVKEGDCASCHSPHTSKYEMMLSARSGAMCLECHDEMDASNATSTHQVFLEGKCDSCHDPHASDNGMNLLRSGSALCFECHDEMGKTIRENRFEHDPVTDDCLECHDPHFSAQSRKLLKAAQPTLCLDCHEVDAGFRNAHENYPVEKGRCSSCHDPHGSNQAAILYANVHKPVDDRKCGECHARSSASAPFALKDNGMELCEGCHYDMVVDALNKKRLHWPMLDEKGCINCHAPHASGQEGLLKEPMLELCGTCHADTVARQARSETGHPPVSEGECSECHSPHSSDNIFLSREATTVELCAACHEWQRHSTHPIGEKIVDPRNGNITVQCSSCHRSHGTEYEHFLYFDTTNEMCVQCHENLRR
jgi:predicted CXXCH cytochrome family protein